MSASLNPALFKLRVSQSKCPVYTGQVLPLLKDKLRLNDNDSLNNAGLDQPFYSVNSVSRQQSHSPRSGTTDTYHLALTPVIWDEAEMTWGPCKDGSVSPHPFDISCSSEELYDHFGILTKSTTSKGAKGQISKYIEGLFKKAKKYNEWLDKCQNIDFDQVLRHIGLRTLSKSSYPLTKEDKEDIFHEALLRLGSTDVIGGFDFSKGRILNFLWGSFYNHMRNGLRDHIQKIKNQVVLKNRLPVEGDPLSTDEYLDVLGEKHSPKPTVEDTVTADQVIEDFKEYLEVQERGDILISILEMLPQKYKMSDIARKFNVPQSTISEYMKKFVRHLKLYAMESHNDLLLSAVKDQESRRNSSVTASVDDLESIRNIFKTYKEKAGSSDITAESGDNKKISERVPVGETIKIERKPLPNFEDLTKQVVQDPEKSSSQASKDVESYLADITSADELIEQDGKLIALRIRRRE